MIKELKYNAYDAWGGHSEYELLCDKCRHSFGFYHTFKDAVAGKKDARFTSIKRNNKWIELCPKCSKQQGLPEEE